jgi:asparagine synthase (glutamine-hydrolysing)
MAASLEVRAPFLDHIFLQWGLGLPANLKIGSTGGKHILKRALEPLLPHDLLYRPKQGFATDLAPLFRREMARVKDILLGPVMLECGFFDARGIESVLEEHRSGTKNHAQPIWLLLAFEGFLASLAMLPEAAPQYDEALPTA